MSADSHTNHYTVLGVARNATLQDIRSAYKKLALKLHPDKAGDGKESTAKFRKVAEAVEILSNSGLRRKHDELLDRSALTGLGLENFWDNFGIGPSYARPAATDDGYWTGPWEANNWGSRSCEAPYTRSWETPYDKPLRRPPHTQPRPVQSREPSPLKKHDIWEAYLYGSRLNGMEYGPDTTDAFPAYNELQQELFLKQKIGGIYSEERDKGAAKAANSSQRRAPRQSATSSHSHEGISDVYIEVLERRIKTRMEALKALMQAHEEELKHEIFFENHLPTRYEGFGNIPAVPDNDKRSVNPTHTACFPGAEHEHHGHAPDDGSSIDSSAPKTGDGMPNEDLTLVVLLFLHRATASRMKEPIHLTTRGIIRLMRQ
ncbi:uncharacterized protein N7477_004083 [Penicillium maclennaniae]|uniref:uncharacterized protein n=1 Tax=Penicillium maclennaniae TaxID=1343394 RepID=UPI0025417AFE|nr:uncharacterized protein N7477_004083 [Penicillium maclennaniae]KAJ5678450.1 hypothetical protein N7477_004083 [Penicillium maclennaniae]